MTSISFDSAVVADYHLALQEATPAEALQQIEQLFTQKKWKKAQEIMIIPNGQPQHVQMLLHYVTMHFPQKLRIQHAKETWKNTGFQQDSTYHILHHLIESNRFVAAEIILKNKDKTLKHLLGFAKRLKYGEAKSENLQDANFYFKTLYTVMLEDVKASPEELRFVEEMQGLQKGSQQPFLYFLQSYTNQLYQNTDLSDFVSMYYRLAEELLLYTMGWDVSDGGYYSIRKGAKQSIPLLGPNTYPPSRHFNSYIGYLKKTSTPYAKELLASFDVQWLKLLIQLRHDGLSGHGFEPYSHKKIQDIVGTDPMIKLDALLIRFHIKAPYCFITLLKTAMAARAKQLEKLAK